MAEIANRTLILKSSSPDTEDWKFCVRLNQPVLRDDKFACSFWIDGLPCGSHKREVSGPDSLAALQEAMSHIEIILNCIPGQFWALNTDFSFGGSTGLGAPIVSEIQEGLAAYRDFNFGAAIDKLLPFAERGIAELQLIVGSMYVFGLEGRHVQDKVAARHWLQAAATQGNGQAYFLLCDPSLREPDTPSEIYDEYLQKAAAGGFTMHQRQS